MKKILSYLLILNFVFFSGFNTIQVSAEEINKEQETEKESTELDEELIPEQQDETEIINNDAESEVEPVQQEEITNDEEQQSQQDEKSSIENNIDSKIESNLNEALNHNNLSAELEQTNESFIKDEQETNSDIEQEPDTNKPIDLKWNTNKPGGFSFNKNGSEGTGVFVEVFKDGVSTMGYLTGMPSNTEIYEGDLSHMIKESGDYTFRVYIYSGTDHNNTDYVSDISEVFHYILPEQKVESPMNVTWDSSNIGLITWDFVDNAEEYLVVITDDDFQSEIVKGIKKYDVPQEDFSEFISPGFTYKAKVMAYSNNINLYAHSDYSESEEFCFQSNSDQENIEEHIIFDNVLDREDNSSPTIPSFWAPTTEEEQLRYSCFGKENVQYTTLNNQPFNVNIQNAMQGEKCFEVFKNVANDYTIARTYNIYPLIGTQKYSTDEKVTLSLTIPEALCQENREFKLICVSQNGTPFIFEDQDEDSNTITISTDKFYAYALVYKDMK